MTAEKIYACAGFRPDEFQELKDHLDRVDSSCSRFRYDANDHCFVKNVSGPDKIESFKAHLALVLANLPESMTHIAFRGVPENVIRDTFSDIALWYRHYQRELGRPGLSSEIMGWLNHHFQGKLFRLGRLQFETTTLSLDTPLLASGEPVLHVHIPEDGRLAAEACDLSFQAAETFFSNVCPYPFKAFAIESWFLAPEFLTLLPENSNIRRFASRFSAVPLHKPGNREIYRRILGEKSILAEKTVMEPQTSLQKLVYPFYLEDRLFGAGAGIILRTNHPNQTDSKRQT